jgi:hypothetical protein
VARYATWADVKWWMDKDPGVNYDEPDTATLQGFEDTQEAIFEDEVRGFLAVPISRTASPDSFQRAKSVCAMRGAAEAIRYFRQTEGAVDDLWWPNRLDALADKMVKQMQSEATVPEDHEAPTNPVQVIPMFGGLPATATFQRRTDTTTTDDVDNVDDDESTHVW